MTYKLKDGRKFAYLKDKNVILTVSGETAKRVHFVKDLFTVIDIGLENGEAKIPDMFFEGDYKNILFYVTDGKRTLGQGNIKVIPRVYEETK